MFKRLVSNLSLSPAAATQLSYYFRRLRRERFTRTLSAVFASALVALQVVVVISPPDSVNASANSQLIRGGFNNVRELLAHYDADPELRAVYGAFNITRADLVNTVDQRESSTEQNLVTLGRTKDFANSIKVVINNKDYWFSRLYDYNHNTIHNTLHNLHHTPWFAIDKLCGNVIMLSPPLPIIQLNKNPAPGYPANGSTVAPGQRLAYEINFPNPSMGQVANFEVRDTLPTYTSLDGAQIRGSADSYTIEGGRTAMWHYNLIESGNTSNYAILVVTVDANAPNGAQICNTASDTGSRLPPASTPPVCYTVKINTPPPPPPPPPTPAQLTLSKTANVVTADNGTTNASGATVTAGNTIQYVLTIVNTGQSPQTNYTITDQLGDVLEYADLVNPGGGVLSADQNLTWPATTIPAGATITKTFLVKVKDPIPVTPTSVANSTSYDCLMNNFFGSSNIGTKVTCAPPKQVEATVQQLPQTGAATDIAIVLGFAAFAYYFYARNRQLTTEIKILRNDYHGGN